MQLQGRPLLKRWPTRCSLGASPLMLAVCASVPAVVLPIFAGLLVANPARAQPSGSWY